MASVPDEPTIIVEDATMRAGFVMLPKAILRSTALSAGAKIAYGLLLDYAWQDGACFPGQARMAADLDCTRQSVSRHIAELVKARVLIVKRRGLGLTNVYILPRLTGDDVTKNEHQDGTKEFPTAGRKSKPLAATRIARNKDPDYTYTGNRRIAHPRPRQTTNYMAGLCATCGARPCMCSA